MKLWEIAILTTAAVILGTFLYQPTLDWHTRTWADPMMGVKR